MGVYILGELTEELTGIIRESGVDSISKIVRESLRLYIAEHRWRAGVDVAGALCVIYDHKARHVDEELTDIQHRYLDVIMSSLHAHLDQRSCLLIVAVRGPFRAVKAFIDRIGRVRGV